MKTMKTKLKTMRLVSFAVLSAATGCNELSGSLTAETAVSLVNNKSAEITLAQGTQNAKLAVKGNDRNELELSSIKDSQGKGQTVDFTLPAGVTIPSSSGQFSAKGADLKPPQLVDLQGSIDTVVETSIPQASAQACSIPDTVTKCTIVAVKLPNGTTQNQKQCTTVNITRGGTQEIVSHVVDTTVTASLVLLDPATGASSAQFSGDTSSSNTITDSVGPCI